MPPENKLVRRARLVGEIEWLRKQVACMDGLFDPETMPDEARENLTRNAEQAGLPVDLFLPIFEPYFRSIYQARIQHAEAQLAQLSAHQKPYR